VEPPPAAAAPAAAAPDPAPPAEGGAQPEAAPGTTTTRPRRPRPEARPTVANELHANDRRNVLIGIVAAVAIVGIFVAYMLLKGTPAPRVETEPTDAPATTAAPAVKLAGSWTGRGTGYHRTADVSVTSNAKGEVVAATVTIRTQDDGIVAGFEVDPKAEATLSELMAAYDPKTKTLDANIPFLRFDDWAPPGVRTFKVLEGVERIPEKIPEEDTDLSIFVEYLILESTEPDVLIQAGISRTGVVMFLNGSRKYLLALGRGHDIVSHLVHPGGQQQISHFEDLVFDLSGGLDFVSDKIDAEVASPLRSTEPISLSLGRT